MTPERTDQRIPPPDIFLGGVIQASCRGPQIVSQQYRARIKAILRRHLPALRVYDPWEEHHGALQYSLQKARETFFSHLDLVRNCRLLIAYLPEASLGTAVEMWEAYRCSRPVVTVSPMTENWVVKLLSTLVCPDLEAFAAVVSQGALARLMR